VSTTHQSNVPAPEATDLPEAARREIAAHHRQYAADPEAAHWWDPGVIGVPGGPVPCLLLHHVGRRSGERLHSILQYYVHGGEVAIVASKGGTAFHPAWYHNLLANPACEVQIGTFHCRATARTVHGGERAAWWVRITREQPMQLEYAARTRREIPVVVLAMPGLPAYLGARGATEVDADTWTAIAHNYATYARLCDEKRYDLATAIFSPDARLHYRVAGHDFECLGGEAAAAFAGFLERCFWTHHLIAHPAVEAAGTRLRATARVTATHIQRRADGTRNRWLVRGSYHDTFEHTLDGWRIVRRDCCCLDAEGEFEADGVARFPAVAWAGREVLG
jgi:deazaflavin-dependent oxidoreductase (nitroreductase family)